MAGLKGYVTNLDASAEFVIDAYHQLFQIEKSFRMSKHDLQARLIYHHKRNSIDAHMTIVFAALAVSRWIEDRSSSSIKKFVRSARRYRTIQIQAGAQTLTAADPYQTTSAKPRKHPPTRCAPIWPNSGKTAVKPVRVAGLLGSGAKNRAVAGIKATSPISQTPRMST